MKVKIMQRSVYHKYAEIEIEVPFEKIHTIDGQNFIHDLLIDNEDLYVDKIDEKISKAKYNFGLGMETSDGWTDKDEESEWRFEVVGQNYGGHL